MSYVDKQLIPGEQVLYRGVVHWWIYVRPLTILGIGFFAILWPRSLDFSRGRQR